MVGYIRRGKTVRGLVRYAARAVGSHARSLVPVVPGAEKQSQSRNGGDANVGLALFLQEDAQTPGHALRRSSIPQNTAKAAMSSNLVPRRLTRDRKIYWNVSRSGLQF